MEDGGGGHWLVRMEWHPAGWSVCLPVNLPLHHKVQKFSSGTGSPGWSQKKGRKTVVCVSHLHKLLQGSEQQIPQGAMYQLTTTAGTLNTDETK